MPAPGGSLRAGGLGLVTDLYELRMAQAYVDQEMEATGVFDLHFRKNPSGWNYVVACGVEELVGAIEAFRYSDDAIGYLTEEGSFGDGFLDWLAGFSFSGRIRTVPEGLPVFPMEPVMQVEAPIAEAQLVEALVLNLMQYPMLACTKASRVVDAAAGRAVVDFGLRRMHGLDAAIMAARAFHIAGVTATSNVAAGRRYGIPISGTMAHSYVQAHEDEIDAFRTFASAYPDTIILVDTYDTLDGVRKVVDLATELGDDFKVRGVRLDSGDLGELATSARGLLDEAGLKDVKVIASGGLDEHEVARHVEEDRPIDGFGVGTQMGVVGDQPYLDIVYKLVEYDGRPTKKLSEGKRSLPGRKQVWRRVHGGVLVEDVVGLVDEQGLEGEPLLQTVMETGHPVREAFPSLDSLRERAAAARESLPTPLRRLDEAKEPYPVRFGPRLATLIEEATAPT